jgi:hypothetical protein
MLNRLSVRLQQLRALLLPSLQLRIALAMSSRHSFFTLGIELLHVTNEIRRFNCSLVLLLLLARLTARSDKLPTRGNVLLHAIQRNRTDRFPVALGPLCCSNSRSGVNIKGQSRGLHAHEK